MARVEEDPDELGYWMGEKPVHPFAAASSLIVCNDLLPLVEQLAIEAAARDAHEGNHEAAEGSRVLAGYFDDLDFHPNPDSA